MNPIQINKDFSTQINYQEKDFNLLNQTWNISGTKINSFKLSTFLGRQQNIYMHQYHKIRTAWCDQWDILFNLIRYVSERFSLFFCLFSLQIFIDLCIHYTRLQQSSDRTKIYALYSLGYGSHILQEITTVRLMLNHMPKGPVHTFFHLDKENHRGFMINTKLFQYFLPVLVCWFQVWILFCWRSPVKVKYFPSIFCPNQSSLDTKKIKLSTPLILIILTLFLHFYILLLLIIFSEKNRWIKNNY